MTKESGRNKEFWLPDDELEALAKCFLPAIRKFYESEENMKAFKKWEAEQQTKKQNSAM